MFVLCCGFYDEQVEDDCKLSAVDEIAGAVYQMLATIQEEAMLN